MRSVFALFASLALIGCAALLAEPGPSAVQAQDKPKDMDGMDVLTRGPLHEAYAVPEGARSWPGADRAQGAAGADRGDAARTEAGGGPPDLDLGLRGVGRRDGAVSVDQRLLARRAAGQALGRGVLVGGAGRRLAVGPPAAGPTKRRPSSPMHRRRRRPWRPGLPRPLLAPTSSTTPASGCTSIDNIVGGPATGCATIPISSGCRPIMSGPPPATSSLTATGTIKLTASAVSCSARSGLPPPMSSCAPG